MLKKIFILLCLIISMVLITISLKNIEVTNEPRENVIADIEIKEEMLIPKDLFEDYYLQAEEIMKDMTLEQKVSQLFLVKSAKNLKIEDTSYLGGYLFFSADFKDETIESFNKRIENLQKNAKIKYIFAVDEEGGTVVRVSSKPNFRNTKFLSPRELYSTGGIDLILQTEEEKISLLKSLGLNLNLAPVADISTNLSDFIYDRSIGLDTKETSDYISKVTQIYLDNNFSSCLKHFPGYGNNLDTHIGTSTDHRTLENLRQKDLLPFLAGIEVRTPFILISHNYLPNIDSTYPASLSKNVIDILKDELEYTGLIITDDLAMGALNTFDNLSVKAIEAGNDILITGDYNKHYKELLDAVKENKIIEGRIDYSVRKIIAWKIAYAII